MHDFVIFLYSPIRSILQIEKSLTLQARNYDFFRAGDMGQIWGKIGQEEGELLQKSGQTALISKKFGQRAGIDPPSCAPALSIFKESCSTPNPPKKLKYL